MPIPHTTIGKEEQKLRRSEGERLERIEGEKERR
jgi:hypothetical protein